MFDQLFLTVNSWMMAGTAIAALGCFLWGMISVAFSPCHLASIPLIVSYVAGQEKALKANHAAHYAVAFTVGLFITIALVGIVCSLLGRMLGEVGPYWTILVGAILIWVALDMLGVSHCSMSGSMLGRIKLKGLLGAFFWVGLRGSFRFLHLRLHCAHSGIITIQQKIATGLLFIILFGIGHCVPIAIAGSSRQPCDACFRAAPFPKGGSGFDDVPAWGSGSSAFTSSCALLLGTPERSVWSNQVNEMKVLSLYP